jgi:hypothetical protein
VSVGVAWSCGVIHVRYQPKVEVQHQISSAIMRPVFPYEAEL